MSFTILPDELVAMCYHGMLPGPRPSGRSTTVTYPANFNYVERERRVGGYYVTKDVPSMSFACEHVVIEVIDGDPAMQGAGFVGPGEGGPCGHI
jgi:hypothetical protein